MLDSCDPMDYWAHQNPLSRGIPRQGYWNGFPLPSPGNLRDPGFTLLGVWESFWFLGFVLFQIQDILKHCFSKYIFNHLFFLHSLFLLFIEVSLVYNVVFSFRCTVKYINIYIYICICIFQFLFHYRLFSSVQSLSHVWLFATPWIAAR